MTAIALIGWCISFTTDLATHHDAFIRDL